MIRLNPGRPASAAAVPVARGAGLRAFRTTPAADGDASDTSQSGPENRQSITFAGPAFGIGRGGGGGKRGKSGGALSLKKKDRIVVFGCDWVRCFSLPAPPAAGDASDTSQSGPENRQSITFAGPSF